MGSKLGRNEECWCGSGKKFKRCHLGRETQNPLGKQESLKRFHRAFEKGHCLHPAARTESCSDRLIRAHTIQRNGALSKIARKGHVYNILKHGKFFDGGRFAPTGEPHRVGIREASTFAGFCERHDDELFAPIEKEPFAGTVRQVALLGYRALCYELSTKESDLEVIDLRREQDRGKPRFFQQIHQSAISYYKTGTDKSLGELEEQKRIYEKVIFQDRSSDLDYYIVYLDNNPEVLCSGIAQSTHDFRGNMIFDLGRLSVPASWLAFSLIPTDTGGVAVFSSPTKHKKSKEVLKTFHELTDSALPHAIIRFVFEFFENTYFSPDWWDSLDRRVKLSLKERQLRDLIGPWGEQEFPRTDGCLLDDGVRAVEWQVVSRIASIDG